MRTLEQTYDVAVFGGGLSGFAAARICAKNGLKTLLIERRPLLGWESTWACALEFDGDRPQADDETVRAIAGAVEAAGGRANGLLDAPILEMVLDREAARVGLTLLYYAQPIGVDVSTEGGDGRVRSVVVGSKSGHQPVRARAFVDATENRLLWSKTGVAGAGADGPGRSAIFINGVEKFGGPLRLERVESAYRMDVRNVSARPSAWPGEVLVTYELPTREPGAHVRALPVVMSSLHAAEPGLAGALVSHTSVEPLPLEADLPADVRHPELPNLFAANFASDDSAHLFAQKLRAGAAAGEQIAAVVPGLPDALPLPEPQQSLEAPPVFESEVLVCGGGTAGAVAAIAAAREGAETTLLEMGTFLGGIGAGGGIHVYYHGISGGLQDEVDERVQAMTALFGSTRLVRGFHPIVKRVVLQQMADEAGVRSFFNQTLTDVQTTPIEPNGRGNLPATGREGAPPRRLSGVIATGPDGNRFYRAEAVIDSTGDGDVAFMAGAPFTHGRESDGLTHTYSQSVGRLDENGRLRGVNVDAGYVDPTDIEDLTRARRLGLSQYWQDRFTPESRFLYVAPLIGLRNSRQIVGEYRLTLADQIATRRFPDAIAYARSHYDNHAFDYQNESDEAMLWVWLMGNWRKQIGSEIPYRCLLPLEVEGLIVACRALSLTHDAHNQMRMQRDMQRIGEAAGVAAAQAVERGVLPRQVPIEAVQKRLHETGALSESARARLDQIREEEVQEGAVEETKLLPNGNNPTAAELMERLDAEDAREAVWAIYRQGEGLVPDLLTAAQDAHPERAYWASVGLAMLERQEAVPALVQSVEQRRDDQLDVRKGAPTWYASMVLLGRLGDERAVPALADALAEPEISLDGLLSAIRALGRIGDAAAVPAIEAALQRTDVETTRTLQNSSKATDAITDDARWQLDLGAAEVLAQLGSPRPHLIEPYLDDGRAYVRRYAQKVRGHN